MEMESFADIIGGYSKRKPSAFTGRIQKGLWDEISELAAQDRVQNNAQNTNRPRQTPQQKEQKGVIDERAKEKGYKEISTPGKVNRHGRNKGGFRHGTRVRSPNQDVIITRDIYGNKGFRTGRPDMVIGTKDAQEHIYNPRWNFFQPPSEKYGLTVQNFTDRYLSKIGRPYIDWEGNLTGDLGQARLKDRKTGEVLTRPPAAMPVEQIHARYEPVMADLEHMIYSSGKEKDDYYEMERARNRLYNIGYEVNKVIERLIEETGLPREYFMDRNDETGVYNEIYNTVADKYDREETARRLRAEAAQGDYREMTSKASELAAKRLQDHINAYKEYLANPESTQPVDQPRGFWVFGSGSAKNKGHYSFAPQLRQYYKEELAKLMGEPAPEPEWQFNRDQFIEETANRYKSPELKNILSAMNDDDLEYLQANNYDFGALFARGENDTYTMRATPKVVAQRLKEYLSTARSSDDWHRDEDARLRAEADANDAKTAQYWAEHNMTESPQQTRVRQREELMGRVHDRLESLLANHAKNRVDPVETGKGLSSLAANYKTTHAQYMSAVSNLNAAISNGMPEANIAKLQERVDRFGAKLEEMGTMLVEQARAAGYSPETHDYAMYETDYDSGNNVPQIINEFDSEGRINPRFMDVINGPKRTYDWYRVQSERELDQKALLERMRTTGKSPKIDGASPENHTVLPGEANVYDQNATDIYWKLAQRGGLNRSFMKQLSSQLNASKTLTGRAERGAQLQQTIDTMNNSQYGTLYRNNETLIPALHSYIDNTIRPEFTGPLHKFLDDKFKENKMLSEKMGSKKGKDIGDEFTLELLLNKLVQEVEGDGTDIYMSPEEKAARLAEIKAQFDKIKPEEAYKMVHGDLPWGGSNIKLRTDKYKQLGEIFKDVLKANVAPGKRGMVMQVIEKHPSPSWQTTLKMLTDPSVIDQEGLWTGDPQQVAYMAQHLNDAKADVEGSGYEDMVLKDPNVAAKRDAQDKLSQALAWAIPEKYRGDVWTIVHNVVNNPNFDTPEKERALNALPSMLHDYGFAIPDDIFSTESEGLYGLVGPALDLLHASSAMTEPDTGFGYKSNLNESQIRATDEAVGGFINGIVGEDGNIVAPTSKLGTDAKINEMTPEQKKQKESEEAARQMQTEIDLKKQKEAEASARAAKKKEDTKNKADAKEKKVTQQGKVQELSTKPVDEIEDPYQKIVANRLQNQPKPEKPKTETPKDEKPKTETPPVEPPVEPEKTEEFGKSWSMRDMENMSIRDMMHAIAKSDAKEGHPYGKPIQGNVFAYGSTISNIGQGRDVPMPETIPTKKTNEEGATSRKLDL